MPSDGMDTSPPNRKTITHNGYRIVLRLQGEDNLLLLLDYVKNRDIFAVLAPSIPAKSTSALPFRYRRETDPRGGALGFGRADKPLPMVYNQPRAATTPGVSRLSRKSGAFTRLAACASKPGVITNYRDGRIG